MSVTLGDLLEELHWFCSPSGANETDLEDRVFAFVNKKAAEQLVLLAEEFSNDHAFPAGQQPDSYLNGFYNGLMKAAKALEGGD